MGSHHNKSFFGEGTGIIFDSGQSSSPAIFLTFIKKKKDGSWEKPSQKEGRAIRFSLVEVAFILQVLSGDKNEWETIHSFKERKASISFEHDSEVLSIKVGNYIKILNYGEIEVFKILLEHVLQEKVITSTEVIRREEVTELKKKTQKITTEKVLEDNNNVESVLVETAFLNGVCNGETEKALLIAFEGKKEIWVPKSAIVSRYDSNLKNSQEFEIDTWILKKNQLL